MNQLLECVPNISEGNDESVIDKITSEVEKVCDVKLLNVDIGKAANRTVITFTGTPPAVVEAAFKVVKKASELIDMSKHKGEHPRMGATDVCPLIPLSNISMEETVKYAYQLAERIGDELNIPVYCYEHAAKIQARKNLANIRSGEYEGLPEKTNNPLWKPDYGPHEFNQRSGVTVVGARDFLIAYNINLNTDSTSIAKEIAFDIREKGRVKKEGDIAGGNVVKDEKGNPVYIPGALKAVKAIGWYIKEYRKAQVSMNLTNISLTPIHKVFVETCKKAANYGVEVTGSEIIGLIPLKPMLDAGKYFMNGQESDTSVPENELVKKAVNAMGLDELKPFNPREKIIEYKLNDISS